MAMETYASVADLVAHWRPLTPEEAKRADTLLLGVSQAIAARAKLPYEGNEAVYNLFTCLAVKRIMEAGAEMPGVVSAMQTTGPFTDQMTFRNPTGDYYLTSEEKRVLKIGRPSVACLWLDGGEQHDTC